MGDTMKQALQIALLLFLVFAFLGCEMITGSDGDADEPQSTDGRPAIPAPTSYLAEVPLLSDEVVATTVPLTNFAARVTVARNEEGNEIASSTDGERVALVTNGNPTPSPTFQGNETLPLSENNLPHLQLVRYWRRIGEVERYSGATTTSISRSVTRGSEQTRTESFAYTLGVSTTVSGGNAFVQASATVSQEFSKEVETEVTISESVTQSETYEVAAEQDENLVFAVWQLVEEYRIVTQQNGEWVPYEDPAYEFSEEDIEGLANPVNEIRNISYRFANTPR